jgi:SulP family sulfate permease
MLMRQGQAWVKSSLTDSGITPFPFGRWLEKYSFKDLKADARAGTTVALLDVPQGMAYAAVAGLPLQFGTTCSAVSGIVGSLFTGSRYTVLGPTNATAFMIFSYFATEPHLDRVAMMPLLVFMVAALLLVGAYLRVAELAQYISRTVVVAYVTGAAVLIVANQFSHVLGVSLAIAGPSGVTQPRTLPGILIQLGKVIEGVQWESVAVAAATAAIYWLIRKLRPAWPGLAIALVVASAGAVWLRYLDFDVATFADARFKWYDLFPPFPEFATSRFLADFSRLFSLAVAIAFLSTVESSSMAKTMSGVQGGQKLDPNQDMYSLGMANLGCAYLSGMPCSGSLTRSALNYSSGARTPVAAIINGCCCLIGALTLGSAVAFVPRAALAVLIICVAVSLINPRNIRICLEATGRDATSFLITFAATLMVPLHVAIFTGIGVSLMLYLRKASRPMLVEYAFNPEGNLAEAEPGVRPHPAISIVHVEGELFFGAADLFRNQVQQICTDPNLRIVIIRLKNARHMDATSVMALDELVHALRKDGRDLIISGVQKDIYRVLRDAGMIEVIGRDNVFIASPSNPNVATRNALRRAQEILGTTEAEVRIYFDPSKKQNQAAPKV